MTGIEGTDLSHATAGTGARRASVLVQRAPSSP